MNHRSGSRTQVSNLWILSLLPLLIPAGKPSTNILFVDIVLVSRTPKRLTAWHSMGVRAHQRGYRPALSRSDVRKGTSITHMFAKDDSESLGLCKYSSARRTTDDDEASCEMDKVNV